MAARPRARPFFFVIAVFWVLKPIKSGLFLSYFSRHPVELLGWTFSGAQAEQLARVLNMIVAYAVVVGFTMVANSCTRRRLILSSKYLLGIAAVLGLYEVVSNVNYFQLLGTSYIFRNWGVGAGLMVLPLMLLVESAGFLVAPVLAVAAFMRVSDDGLNYSVSQFAKEALYTPTSQEVKYKAKAFIDMFVQRAAKVLAVVVNLVLSVVVVHVRWLSLVTLAVVAAWIAVVLYVGREFRRRAEETPAGEGVAA